MRALIAILLLLTIGLGAGLFYRHSTARKEKTEDTETISQLTGKASETERKLAEQTAVNAVLDRDLATRTQQLLETSNTLVNVSATLVKVREEAQIAATNAAADIAKRDARINELETQRDDLTKRMTDLNGQISGYESQIAEIQRKLTTSEGDREYLLAEMKRLQREKNDLERQFNDIAMLREQVRKMRDELSISRRLDWIRRGLYGSLKGAERLQKSPTTPSTNQFDLNVELKESGTVKVTPLPNPPATNTPPATQPQ